MALITVQGNLLTAPEVDIIVHCANCFSTMGKGIAKDIKTMFPASYKADTNYPLSPEDRLGTLSYAICQHPESKKQVAIVNLYGQYDYWKLGAPRDKVWANYAAVESALTKMFDTVVAESVEEFGIVSPRIGIPYNMCCGLAGGDWNVITEIANRVSEERGFDIYAYRI